MNKVIGANLHITNENGMEAHIQLPAPTPTNGELLTNLITGWANYNYANSSAWLIPNILFAVTTSTSTKWVVPITNYDGPTGETELVTLDIIRA